MGLVKCRQCRREISALLKNCRWCGEPVPQKPTIWGVIFLLAFISVMFRSSYHDRTDHVAGTPAAQAKTLLEMRVTLLASGVKKAIYEQNSLKFISVTSNNDGSTVCMEYRENNRYGGLSIEKIVFSHKNTYLDKTSWNQYCNVAGMHDVKFIAQHAA